MAQISSWSRAMQWTFWAALFTIVFLIWDSTIATLGETWATRADQIEMQIVEVNKPIVLTSSVKKIISAFGEVDLPREKAKGAAALTDAVHKILNNHAVEKDEYTRTKTTKMKSSALPGIGRSGQQVEQVFGDIRFLATQEDVLKVISALESSPAIDAVSDIRLTKETGRIIRVNLSVEAWVLTSSKRRGRK